MNRMKGPFSKKSHYLQEVRIIFDVSRGIIIRVYATGENNMNYSYI